MDKQTCPVMENHGKPLQMNRAIHGVELCQLLWSVDVTHGVWYEAKT